MWYKDEQHIGYDHDAKKLIRRERKDKLDTLLAQTDTKQASRTIYDEYNDEEIVLSKDELRLIQRIRQGQFPDVEVGSLVTCRCMLWLCHLLVHAFVKIADGTLCMSAVPETSYNFACTASRHCITT